MSSLISYVLLTYCLHHDVFVTNPIMLVELREASYNMLRSVLNLIRSAQRGSPGASDPSQVVIRNFGRSARGRGE